MMLRSGGGDVDPVPALRSAAAPADRAAAAAKAVDHLKNNFPKTTTAARLQRSATIHRRARLRLARAGKRSERAAAAPAHDVAIGWRRRRPRSSLRSAAAAADRAAAAAKAVDHLKNNFPKTTTAARSTLGHDSPPRSASPRARGKTQRESGCGPPAHDVAIGGGDVDPVPRCARPLHPPIAPPPRPKLSITSKTICQKQRPRPAPRSATIHRRARLRLARAGKRSERRLRPPRRRATSCTPLAVGGPTWTTRARSR